MTTTEKLQTLLSGISQNIEVHREFHRGHGESYIVHEILTESDGEYSDDEPEVQVDTVRVHYFTKGNPTPVKKQIRRLLRENDFTIISPFGAANSFQFPDMRRMIVICGVNFLVS